MANEIEFFWKALPPDLKGFIVSTAAGWASSLASRLGARERSDVHQALQDAYQEGLKNFIPHFGENCRYAMQDLLADEEAKSFLNDIIRDESLASDPRCLEDAISRADIDTGTIDGFDIHQAVDSFLQGFLAKAELSKELIPWLSLDELRKIRKTLKPVTPDLDNLREKYFTYLWEQHSHMSFKGLTEGKLLSIPLKDLYTRLSITEELPADSREYLRSREEADRMELTRHMERVKKVDLSDIVESEYSVITGDPGSGKSTLLKYIALAYVDQEQKERLGTEEDLLPILFPIAAYAERFRRADRPAGYCLREFIPEYFKGENLPDLDPLFQDAAGNGRALFLMDGLDEVSDETERKKMVRHVRNFIIDNEYAGNRYCVTCRTASYTKATRFEPVSGTAFSEYCVQPFDEDQISHFLLSWYRCYEREIKHREQHIETRVKDNRDRMMAAITGDLNILSIARNPLMLTILALIEHEGGELPQNRADLYEKCLKMLAGSWQKIRSIHETEGHGFMLGDMRIDDVFVIEYLGPIATEMHKNAAPAIEYTDLRTRLTEEFDEIHRNKQLSRQNAENFIRIMREGSGILQEVSPGTYGFMHQTFKEYLTARVLTDLRDEPVAELGEGLFEPEWKEVVFLTAASLKKNPASNFVSNIMEKETEHFRNLILAGECVKDIGRNRVFQGSMTSLSGEF
ncbi:MAG: NACHT domain-containing protein [Proteobacteria bacterium]|nr:NACHT domain-containing protein [Pseudomonadota bacterium]